MEIIMNGKKISKKTLIISAVVVFVAVCIIGIVSNRIGYNENIDDRVTSDIVNSKIQMDNEYHEKETKLSEISAELDKQQELVNEFNNYKENKSNLEQSYQELSAKVTELETTVSSKQYKISELDNTISEKNTEIEKLKNVIVKTGEAPITIPAGDFTVGTDIPAGRYSATGSSNLFVYSASGRNKVNTILGKSFGVESYVCNLDNGDTVSARAKTTFTPVK